MRSPLSLKALDLLYYYGASRVFLQELSKIAEEKDS